MAAELWNDGDLRSTTLGTNGFPDEHEAALPDELFFDTPDGEVQVIHEPQTYGVDAWAVSGPTDGYETSLLFDDFGEAFARALLLVRREVEV